MAITDQTHFRSISLPSRLDQIRPQNLESELGKIRSCSATSESIQSGILGLAELYNSVEGFTQKAADHHHQDGKSMEEPLSYTIDLLDACITVRDLLQMIRENVHSLQSALRRKGMYSGIQNDVSAYISFRKKMQKTVAKTLKNLKKSESAIVKNESSTDSDFSVFFRQVAGVTISMLRSVLVFMSPSYTAARLGAWSLFSRLMVAKPGRESDVVSVVRNMDLALNSPQWKISTDGCGVLDLKKTLQIVDGVIEGLEGGMERLFRQLVQTRVTLLNILTDN